MPSPVRPSARVLANRAARIVMNRAALDELEGGMADGLLNLGLRIILQAEARAPRDPEAAAARGVPMMADTGGVQVWARGKRVGGVWEKRPPRASAPKDQVVMFVGFGAPIAHLVELGTIKMSARPFLTPAVMANLPDAGDYVKGAMSRRAASAPQRAARGAAINARRAAEATP